MHEIDIAQDQLDYVGLLAAPAFRLFTSPAALASGLYHAFQGFHSGTDAITFEGDVAQPLRQACAVDLGSHGTYKVSLERVEWTRPSAWTWKLDSAVLAHGDTWLRTQRGAGTLMHSHYFTYAAHAFPLSTSARELIMELGAPALAGFGEGDGTGLIFHTRVEPEGFPMQLTIDHSHQMQNCIFVELVVRMEQDEIDHAEAGLQLLRTTDRALAALGLKVVTGVG